MTILLASALWTQTPQRRTSRKMSPKDRQTKGVHRGSRASCKSNSRDLSRPRPGDPITRERTAWMSSPSCRKEGSTTLPTILPHRCVWLSRVRKRLQKPAPETKDQTGTRLQARARCQRLQDQNLGQQRPHGQRLASSSTISTRMKISRLSRHDKRRCLTRSHGSKRGPCRTSRRRFKKPRGRLRSPRTRQAARHRSTSHHSRLPDACQSHQCRCRRCSATTRRR